MGGVEECTCFGESMFSEKDGLSGANSCSERDEGVYLQKEGWSSLALV
jgi:hypothetical protein